MPASRLSTLTRDQLVALVERLVDRHPDLEDLVSLPLPGEARQADAAPVHAHVTRILRTMGDDWRASSRAQYALFPIVEMGNAYRAQGLPEDARIVYRAIIDAVLALYESIRDEESEIADVVGDCVAGLGACLGVAAEPLLRAQLLADVFHVYRWDTLEHGGYGMDEPAEKVLLACHSSEDRSRVAGWLRDALVAPAVSNYGRARAGALVVKLVGAGQDVREREAIYRQARMDRELMALLLGQGRKDDALALLLTPGADVVSLADVLVAAGLEAQAVALVNAHADVVDHERGTTRRWLTAHGVAGMNAAERLAWDLHAFERSGNVGHWDTLRRSAESLGRLPQVLPRAVAAVRTERTGYQAAGARVLAVAGHLGEAETVLARLPAASWKQAALAVAEAAATVEPARARAIYDLVAAQLEARGTRAARAELAEVRGRMRALDEEPSRD